MKHALFTFAVVITLVSVNAQTNVNGYYITQENDTVVAQIKFPKGFFGQNNFTNLIEVVDSANEKKRFTPADIKGYGYSADGYKYIFFSKPVNDGSYKFMSPVFIGRKASLYQYAIYTGGSGYALPSQKTFYTFEKPDNKYLSLVGRLTKNFKTELQDFFKEDPEVLQLIDDRLKYWLEMKKDLLLIMLAANKQ